MSNTMREALDQSLRQWKMYSEIQNATNEDLETAKTPEGDLYRKCRAAYQAAQPPGGEAELGMNNSRREACLVRALERIAYNAAYGDREIASRQAAVEALEEYFTSHPHPLRR